MTKYWLKVCIFFSYKDIRKVFIFAEFSELIWALLSIPVPLEWITVVNISPRHGQMNVLANDTAPALLAFILNQPLVNHFYIVTRHIKATHMGHQIHCQRHQIGAELQFYSISLLGWWLMPGHTWRERSLLCVHSALSPLSPLVMAGTWPSYLLWIPTCLCRWPKGFEYKL